MFKNLIWNEKCGQVTYAKQLSAALEQEGVELTL